jgi:maltose O-acetyltransferase
MLSLLRKPYAPPRGPIARLRRRLHGFANVDALVARGLQLGRGVYIGPRTTIDPWHCWLIAIGDDATLAPGVQILAHDASTKRHLGWTRVGRVVIGRRAFIGAGSTILPDTTIGDDAIVGAGSVVCRDVAPGTVAVGNPAREVARTEDYVARHRAGLAERPRFPWQGWTLLGGISEANKQHMRDALRDGEGYVE